MYSNKKNVNILTYLLAAHGIKHVVVCPGSRNAPIVHNLNEHPSISCHAATDERSAGFYALGMALEQRCMVAVCVTSGSAMLNVAPAVAEAFYQHVPLVVITADRPRQWIGQLDGQTMPQSGGFGCFVKRSVNLPEPTCEEEEWFCNRLVNEALCIASHPDEGPVQINVPITEPLFGFDTPELPRQRVFSVALCLPCSPGIGCISDLLAASRRTMFVFGQMPNGVIDDGVRRSLSSCFVMLAEPLSHDNCDRAGIDEAVEAIGNDPNAVPYLVVYAGGTIVSKRLRHYLRRTGAETVLLAADGTNISDPTMHLARVVECGSQDGIKRFLGQMAEHGGEPNDKVFNGVWHEALDKASLHAAAFEPCYSQMSAVKCFESRFNSIAGKAEVHYANSTAIRLACIYAKHYVWCNRGLNGIEGSLSAAAGFSITTGRLVFCVIGDLSFFYDQNALWNQSLRGNFRILLLNNHTGGIFGMLPGLDKSPAEKCYVSASHTTNAKGICLQCGISYMSAHNADEMERGMSALMAEEAECPMLLEVFTEAETDNNEMKKYYKQN